MLNLVIGVKFQQSPGILSFSCFNIVEAVVRIGVDI